MSVNIFDLSGRTALITGASRGLGKAMAIGLAEAGATVIVSSRTVSSLEEIKSEIEDFGGNAHTIALDVQDIKTAQHAIARVDERLEGIDILINNAGYEEVAPSLDVDEPLWEKIVGTNLKGAFFCAQAVAQCLTRSGSAGSIINVCSLTSYVGVPTAAPYGSSKSGLLGMTRALSAEWAASGIRVNAIAPGYFRTDLTEQFYQDENWAAAMRSKIPMGHFGDSTDLKGAAIFLASDASRYVTGQCLVVDGGYLASV